MPYYRCCGTNWLCLRFCLFNCKRFPLYSIFPEISWTFTKLPAAWQALFFKCHPKSLCRSLHRRLLSQPQTNLILKLRDEPVDGRDPTMAPGRREHMEWKRVAYHTHLLKLISCLVKTYNSPSVSRNHRSPPLHITTSGRDLTQPKLFSSPMPLNKNPSLHIHSYIPFQTTRPLVPSKHR